MNNKNIVNISVLALALFALVFIFWWIRHDPSDDLVINLAGSDNRGSGNTLVEVDPGSVYEFYSSEYIKLDETWPRFRGSDFDNISKSSVDLIESFPSEGPDILWSVEMGEGHAGAAIYEGLAYVMDYDEEQRADLLRCFSLSDGKEMWRCGYEINVKRNHGMSRTIPAVTENFILTIGPMCHVMCLNREDGNFLWGLDIAREYNSEVPLWYTGQCSLIDEGKAIIATGGDALMIAMDCMTGKKIWEAPNPDGWKMSHSSVIPFTYGGRKMYVYSATGGIAGVGADGEDAGKVLWKTDAWNHSVVAPSPVCMPDGKIFMTAGYGAGSILMKLSAINGDFSIEVLDEYAPRAGLACEQQTPIYWNGHLFGILPKDGGPLRNQFVCVEPGNPREIVWESGTETRFGLGPYIIAGNKFFILNDDGTLTIARPSTERYIQLDQVKVIKDGHDAWAPIAIANGYLIMRDSKTMVCLDIKV